MKNLYAIAYIGKSCAHHVLYTPQPQATKRWNGDIFTNVFDITLDFLELSKINI